MEILHELLEYSHYYNQKLILHFIEREKVPEKSLSLLNHIISAHHIWISRISNDQASVGVWDILSLEELSTIENDNYNKTIKIIAGLDLKSLIYYTNTQGKSFTNSIQDILLHVVNHATYHRAQIASDCKQNCIEPLITDYIVYKREINK